ncbi:hypothetical protein J6590_054688 [Homalodisca vitripennis]|nr:hypothetical protein J6590_054688 [Homalodisca vitripennis]
MEDEWLEYSISEKYLNQSQESAKVTDACYTISSVTRLAVRAGYTVLLANSGMRPWPLCEAISAVNQTPAISHQTS